MPLLHIGFTGLLVSLLFIAALALFLLLEAIINPIIAVLVAGILFVVAVAWVVEWRVRSTT